MSKTNNPMVLPVSFCLPMTVDANLDPAFEQMAGCGGQDVIFKLMLNKKDIFCPCVLLAEI